MDLQVPCDNAGLPRGRRRVNWKTSSQCLLEHSQQTPRGQAPSHCAVFHPSTPGRRFQQTGGSTLRRLTEPGSGGSETHRTCLVGSWSSESDSGALPDGEPRRSTEHLEGDGQRSGSAASRRKELGDTFQLGPLMSASSVCSLHRFNPKALLRRSEKPPKGTLGTRPLIPFMPIFPSGGAPARRGAPLGLRSRRPVPRWSPASAWLFDGPTSANCGDPLAPGGTSGHRCWKCLGCLDVSFAAERRPFRHGCRERKREIAWANTER